MYDAANTRYVAFDDEATPAEGDENVDVTLVGSASYNTFCGDLTEYAWYSIAGLGGGINSTVASGSLTPPAAIPNLPQTLATGSDYTDYFYRLCVNNLSSAPGCADVAVRASHNLPPTAAIQSASGAPPFTIPSGSTTPRVTLIDVGGDGFETIPVQGKCSDPESLLASLPPSCTWTAEEEVTVTGQTFPFEDGDPADFITSYDMTAPVSGGFGGGFGGGGSSDIFLTATDDHGYTSQARVQIRVRAVFHDVEVRPITPPSVLPATVGTPQTVTVTVRNNGYASETFTVTLIDTTGGTVSQVTSQPVALTGCVDTTTYPDYTIPLSTCPTTPVDFTWTPTAPAGQPHILTASVTPDPSTWGGATESSTSNNSATLSVAMVNQAPTADPQSKTTNEDTSVGITLTGTDLDGDTLTYQVATGPTHGTLSGTAPNLTYAPALNYNGPDSFTFTVNDGSGPSAPATVDITVNAVNDAPSFTKGGNQTVSVNAGAQTVNGWATNIMPGPGTATDESGQTLTFNIVSNSSPAIFTTPPAISSTGTLTYTPSGTSGTSTIGVQLQDSGSGVAPNVNTSATQTFTITVNPVCSGAVCAPTGVTAVLNATRQVRVSWTDVATNETSYQVQRCRLTFGFCSYSTVTGSPFAANTNTILNTVSSAGTYRYRVRACNGSTCSAYVTSNSLAVP